MDHDSHRYTEQHAISEAEMALPSVEAERASSEQPRFGIADRAALTAQIGEIMVQMRDSGFTVELAAQLDNRDQEPEIVKEIFSEVLTRARYRLQERSTVVTRSMQDAMHKQSRTSCN